MNADDLTKLLLIELCRRILADAEEVEEPQLEEEDTKEELQPPPLTMGPEDLKAWMESMNYRYNLDAARALEVDKSTIARYLWGETKIPKTVVYTCWALKVLGCELRS